MKRFLILNLFCAFPLFSATANWIINNGGSWNINGNWNTGTFPNASGDVAQLFTAISSPQQINLAQPITVGTLSIDNAFAYTVASVSGPLTLDAPGTPLISVDTTNGSANHVISAPITLTKSSNISVTSPASLNISGAITGAFAITKNGNGTLILSGTTANSFTSTVISQGTLQLNKTSGDALTGSVSITGGTLELLAANQIADGASVSLQSGAFDMNGFSETLGVFTWSNGTFTSGGAVLTASSIAITDKTLVDPFVLTGPARTLTYLNSNNGTAVVQGNVDLGGGTATFIVAQGTNPIDMDIQSVISNGGITIAGSGGTGGTLQFSGGASNTYTSTTSISNVALILNKDATFIAVPGNLSINTAASVTLMEDDQIASTAILSMGTSGNPTFDMNGHNQTLRQFFYNSGTFNQGVGTLTLTDSVTALQMASTTTILGNVVITGTGAVVFQNTFGGSATINGNINLSGNTTTFAIANVVASPIDMNITGGISNGGLTKTLPGTLQFSGSTANTYLGTTTISAGALELNKTGVNAIAGDVTINGLTASLKLIQADQIADTSTLTLTTGTFDMNGMSETITSFRFNGGSLSNAGTLTLTGAGTALQMGGTTMTAPMVLTGGGSIVTTASGTATVTGSLNMSGSTTTFDIPDGATSIEMDFQGAISSGALTKIGTGVLQFSGGSPNTYNGVTTITAGTLLLNRTATAIAGNITINGGTLTLGTSDQIVNTSVITQDSGVFNRGANSETIATYIFNDGTYSQTGGTLTLADATNALTMGNKTITGALAFTGGGSAVFNGSGGTATISGNLNLGGSTTVFNVTNADNTAQVGGIISNGGLTKQGLGTLILTGANSYAGGTLVSAGVLQGDTTSLQGDITDNASLVFEQNASGTYADSITGTGSFVKQGGGELILSSSNSFSGSASINAGTLTVNGTLGGGSTLTVGPSAILKGTGVITKVGTIQGTLAPGNSIGTIFFVGNQTFATGSTLEVELDPTTSDHVDILGSLTIQPGSTLFLMPQPGVYVAPMVYNLIHASAGVTGTFTTITSSLPLLNAVVVHAPFDVLLRLEAAFDPFTSLFNSGNAGQVAKCLDALEATPCSNLTAVINELRLIPSVEGLEDALLQLQPSQYTALAIAGENDVLYVKQALYNRLEMELHTCCDERSSQDKGTLWVTGLASHTSQKRHGEELGFIANTPGALLAYDAPLGRHYRLGGALAYTQTHLHWKGSSDRANIQSGYGTLYGSCFNKRGYALASLMAGYNAYSIRRFVEFGVFDVIDTYAKSHHGGFETSGHLKLGLKYGCKGLVVSPFASVDYIFLHEKGFHETGAQSMNLNVSSKNSDLLSSEGGLDFSYCFRSAKGTYTPYLIVSAIRESRFYGDKENASFECGCNMTVYGYYPSRTLGGVAAGINAELFHSTFSLSYLGRYAKGYGDSTISLQYDYAF